jgi:hypothetical protein
LEKGYRKEIKMNNQDVLNMNYDWFIVQGHKQSNKADGTSCAYRGYNGNKCAIGAVIPDELYQTDFDTFDFTVTKLLDRVPVIEEYFKDCSREFLKELQTAHDSPFLYYHFGDIEKDDFKSIYAWNLKRLAKEFGLVYPGDIVTDTVN